MLGSRLSVETFMLIKGDVRITSLMVRKLTICFSQHVSAWRYIILDI